VDTSAWIHALRRRGNVQVRERVRALLNADEALLCDMVRVELWHGARGLDESQALRDLERDVPSLPTTQEVWDLAVDLARKAHQKGYTLPASDLLIAACARHYSVNLEHDDTHFNHLAQL
jgi:predicted nucleic acid-binding protein